MLPSSTPTDGPGLATPPLEDRVQHQKSSQVATFTVDTHIFRELGQSLVGRDSTALIELLKNAYDADATNVTVHGQNLKDEALGEIIVIDDGGGMTLSEFTDGFLRIASRLKDDGPRRSTRFKRRYTGAKGIGRLAAHKLARTLEISSVSWKPGTDGQRMAVEAKIDWDAIEQYETLDELSGGDGVQVRTTPVAADAPSYTKISLTRLRKPWTPSELGRFIAEVQTYGPPNILSEPLPKRVLTSSLIFRRPTVRESARVNDPFQVQLLGEFEEGEAFWQIVADAASWVIEISAEANSAKVKYSMAPTQRTLRELPEARSTTYTSDHPAPGAGPFFQTRILVREGPFSAQRPVRTWATRSGGIRVFFEGFRILPYGEAGNDWLHLDSDYTRRTRILDRLETEDYSGPAGPDEGLLSLPNTSYYGAVYLTEKGAPSLRLVVNREGFVPDSAYEHLTTLVRRGIDLNTRDRASLRQSHRTDVKKRAKRPSHKPAPYFSTVSLIEDLLERAANHAKQATNLDSFVKTPRQAGARQG